MSDDRTSPHEIVVVRRRGGSHDDGHHGGAWKIAFADFMTALMCFFLVMWLINSTDKKTLTQVAAYFNPLRLNERLPSQKGMHDPGPQDARSEPGDEKQATDEHAPSKPAKAAVKGKKRKEATEPPSEAAVGEGHGASSSDATDSELLRDPYAAIERIANGETGTRGSMLGRELPRARGLPRDTFDPRVRAGRSADDMPKAPPTPEKAGSDASANGSQQVPPSTNPTIRSAGHAENASKETTVDRPISENSKPPATEDAETGASASAIEKRLREALADIAHGLKPNIEVTDLKKEILISLTDDLHFGMFAVGSARPTRELVTVMERVAKALSTSGGAISIRGHTDARQYRTSENDNWRLSMARAQMAFYMLIRGGLAESRIRQLEGYADRNLKSPTDPLASTNRRIEILIAKEH
jgi:chemotaxis protein MotB